MTLELPIIDDQDEMLLLAPHITLGCMYFPDDADSVDAFVTALCADSLLDNSANDAETNRAWEAAIPEARSRLWKSLPQNKEAKRILGEAKKTVPQARLAADVLTVALRLGAYMPRLASVNNAVRIVCKAWANSRSRVMADWGHFKPVANLWAAVFALPVENDDYLVGLLGDRAKFVAFLSLAETFRLRAEQHQASGATAPLLPKSTAFAVPAALNIGSVPAETGFALAPLEGWMTAELGAN